MGTPILRCGFHDDFVDLVLDQPRGQRTQLVGARAYRPPLKLILTLDGDISNHHCEHPLVHIDSRDPVWHTHLLRASGERA